MAGSVESYNAVPYLWTIQYMIRLDYVGHASGGDEQVIRGNLSEQNFIAYYLQNGKVAAAAGMNRDPRHGSNHRIDEPAPELDSRRTAPPKFHAIGSVK